MSDLAFDEVADANERNAFVEVIAGLNDTVVDCVIVSNQRSERLLRKGFRVGGRVAEHVEEEGLGEGVEFGEGGAAYQHAANSVLRAVETRRPVLRCGNGGWSGWIDEFGNVRSVLLNDDDSIYFRGTRTIAVTRDARWMSQASFYVQHGDWFVAVSAALILFGFVLLRSGALPENR